MMSGTAKVVWKEGMFLQPQHFQQSERSVLNQMNQRFISCFPHYYGFLSLAIDRDALANNLFQVGSCAGILPDGTFFDMPREDGVPAARSFAEQLTPGRQSLDVYLALPLAAEGRMNVAGADGAASGAPVRYRVQLHPCADEVSGIDKKEIDTAAPAFTILFGTDSLDGYSCLKIARLVRSPNGQVVTAESFMPPLLHIGCSPALVNDLRTVMQVLMARITSLSTGRKQVEGGFAVFSNSEETAFRLLQTLNTYAPVLNHLHQELTVHPYELFNSLTMLTGALCTFSADSGIAQLPRYDHNDLAATFGGLVRVIRSILEADISAGCVTLPLTQVNQATYSCGVPDPKLFGTAKFYLGVAARVTDKELIVGVIQRVKMCARERLDLLISSAMPGVTLMHASRPPEGLSTKPGFVYFAIDQQGAMWEGVKTAGNVAFYFPNNFPELKIEMLALKG